MIAHRLRLNPDGRSVSQVKPSARPRPISCPPPSTVDEVYRASQVLLRSACRYAFGVSTREGTTANQAAAILETAGLLRHVDLAEPDGIDPSVHVWEVTALGQFEFERKMREGR